MKISTFQGILMGVFGLGAVIGLFVFATYKGNDSANLIGPVVIWGTIPAAGVQATISALAPTTPEMKNVSYVEKNQATLVSDLATAIATGSSPDLVLASHEELLALSKFITPVPLSTLPASMFQAAFVDAANIFTAPNGAGYLGVPFLVDPLVLFSNRTILSSDGIARPPSTWEALTGLVPKVADLTPSRQITRGFIALGTYNNVRNARGILSTLFLQTGVPISGVSASGILTASLGERASTGGAPGIAVVNFYTQFADPTKVSYTWNASLPDSEQMFLSGDLALYLGYSSRARYLRAANPNLDFTVSTIPQPATATSKSVYGLVYAFLIPSGSRNSSGAYQVAALLANPEGQKLAATNTGLTPATLSELATQPADPAAAIAYAEALYMKTWLSPLPANTDQVFSGMIGNVISGRYSTETALITAAQTLTSLLQQ